jgi:mannose-6-phosphate isomerase
VSLLLNLVTLHPGEALRLDAGNLHAYVSGAGIELMAASDNVVRGGLTNKPVDIDLLLEIVDTNALHEPVLPTAQSYELPDVGVALRRINVGDQVVTNMYSLSIRDDGVCCCTPPGETIDSSVGSWSVVSAQ